MPSPITSHSVAGGCSICARSDAHEESSADIARRMAKARKKMAEQMAANK